MKEAFSICSKINGTVSFKGKEYLYFSGTAYLGMNTSPEFEEMVLKGITRYGLNYGASRRGNVQLKVYDEMEVFFADGAAAERALVLSSGFMSGHLAARILSSLAHVIWVAPDAHPAILPEGISPDTATTFSRFSEQCVEESRHHEGKTIVILANSVDPLMPEIHSYDWIRKLSDKNDYYLLLDDSHAFGLVGKGVFGSYSKWKDLPVELVVSGSLGKALGIPAGIVLGSAEFIRRISRSPAFIGASPPPPAFCQAFLDAQELYVSQQQKLQANFKYFLSLIQGLEALRYKENFPVIILDPSGWGEKLMKKHILISSFPYPNEDYDPVDRIVLSANHRKEDLDYLSEAIHGIIFPPRPPQ